MRKLLTGAVRRVFQSLGYEIMPYLPKSDDELVRDFEPEEREDYQQVVRYTLTGPARVVSRICSSAIWSETIFSGTSWNAGYGKAAA